MTTRTFRRVRHYTSLVLSQRIERWAEGFVQLGQIFFSLASWDLIPNVSNTTSSRKPYVRQWLLPAIQSGLRRIGQVSF